MTKKRRRHTPDQIIRKFAEGNKVFAGGRDLEDVCRHLEVAESTRRLATIAGLADYWLCAVTCPRMRCRAVWRLDAAASDRFVVCC